MIVMVRVQGWIGAGALDAGDRMTAGERHEGDPVLRLLVPGRPSGDDPGEWIDYAVATGIGPEHVDALIDMAGDTTLLQTPAEPDACWAPQHAWRALGQLRAVAAVAPLLALLKVLETFDDEPDRGNEDAFDDATAEIPVVLGMIGAAAIPQVAAFALDRANPPFAVGTAIAALCVIGEVTAECREACIGTLARLLDPEVDADEVVCGFTVSALIDLKAVETMDAIRAAFRRDAIDQVICGSMEEVEIEFGLRKPKRKSARQEAFFAAALEEYPAETVRRDKVGRNEPCPCGSGKKYKKCCLNAPA